MAAHGNLSPADFESIRERWRETAADDWFPLT
jgi:hypothetical protein